MADSISGWDVNSPNTSTTFETAARGDSFSRKSKKKLLADGRSQILVKSAPKLWIDCTRNPVFKLADEKEQTKTELESEGLRINALHIKQCEGQRKLSGFNISDVLYISVTSRAMKISFRSRFVIDRHMLLNWSDLSA